MGMWVGRGRKARAAYSFGGNPRLAQDGTPLAVVTFGALPTIPARAGHGQGRPRLLAGADSSGCRIDSR
jgi:hypothetical protein